jgi:hypothetical protein
MFTSPRLQFKRVTSEFNSHLAVHCDHVRSAISPFTRYCMAAGSHHTHQPSQGISG